LTGRNGVANADGSERERDRDAFSYGLLCESDACEGQRLQARARRIWDKAARKPGWLH
jgi:hypothetical protein